jgi:hypothetical protein
MPCFIGKEPRSVVNGFVGRFHLNKSDYEYHELVDQLIYDSVGNWRTYQYDLFQQLTNGILP